MTSGLRQESRRRFSTWRNLLLGAAVLGLIVGLTTRYCDLSPSVSTTAAVSSGANAKHQPLDRDAFEWTPQQKFSAAERDQSLPTISVLGAVGVAPVRSDHLSNWYGAVGVNIEVSVFNGFRFSSQTREADLRSQATQQQLDDLRTGLRVMFERPC